MPIPSVCCNTIQSPLPLDPISLGQRSALYMCVCVYVERIQRTETKHSLDSDGARWMIEFIMHIHAYRS